MGKPNILAIILLLVGFIFAIILGVSLAGDYSPSSRPKHDGVEACKNCGRTSIYALGYCKSCYKSFIEFTYGDD